MNSELVFSKTAAGEEALLAQGKDSGLSRAIRTVLILVDGRSTVAELGAKMSSLDSVRTALAELEQRGYVVPRASGAQDSAAFRAGERPGAGMAAISGAMSDAVSISVATEKSSSATEAGQPEKALVETVEVLGVTSSGSLDSGLDFAGSRPLPKKQATAPVNDLMLDNDPDSLENLEGVPVLMEVVDPSQAVAAAVIDGRDDAEARKTAVSAAMPGAGAADRNGAESNAGRLDAGLRGAVVTAGKWFGSIGRVGSDSIAGRWQAWRKRRQAARNEKTAGPGRREPGSRAFPVREASTQTTFLRGMSARQTSQPGKPRKSVRLARRPSGMKKSLITLVLLAVLGAAVLTAFPPLSVYLAEIESSMSASLGRPVKIGRLSASVYPHPGVLLGNVVIDGGQGSADGTGDIHIDRLWLEPDVRTLFSPRKDLRHVFVNGMKLAPETLAALPAILQQANGGNSKFHVDRLRFEQVTLSIPKLTIGGLQGQAELSDTAGLSALQLHTDDRTLGLTLKPDGQRIGFEADGAAMRIPALAPVDFNSISVKGVWENGVMDVSAFDFRLFDGALKGQAKVRLAPGGDKDIEDIAVEGDLVFDHVDSSKLSAALGAGNLLAGELAGKASFSGAAGEWASLLPALTAEGSFMIERGGLNGVDLVEAARRTSDAPVLGGAMSFEQFSGKMRLTAARSRFYGLVMHSGRMHSAGAVEVAANQSLSGRMDLQIRGSVNQVRVPIVLDGTLQSPSLRAIRPQRTAPAVSATSDANGNAPAARPEAPGTERDDGNLPASRESGNVLLPSVSSARF